MIGMRERNRRGLTLLELLVVITLLALVTATVVVRLGGRWPEAALADAVSRWEFADAQLRSRACRTGRAVALHFEVGGNRLECALDPNQDEQRTPRTFPQGVRFTKFLTSTREASTGQVTIQFTDHGTTDTFALEFTSGSKLRKWIVVAGLTGQISEIANEGEAKRLLELLLPAGLHAGGSRGQSDAAGHLVSGDFSRPSTPYASN